MTQLYGITRPTAFYPRLRYGTPAVTLDVLEGLMDWTPSTQALRGANYVATGEIEYLFNRIEEAASLTVLCLPSQYAQLRRAVEQSLMTGMQCEAWVDRYTGSCWLFSEHLTDQNGLPLVLNTGLATYVDLGGTHARGLSLGASQSLSVGLAQASAATRTGYDDPLSKTEGVLLLDVRPTWAANDNTQHVFLDTSGTTSNRLRLYKTTGNALRFEILDGAAGSKIMAGTPTWAANARVEIVARWTTTGTLQLWYAVDESPWVALTTGSGAGTGILGALGTSLYVGANNGGTEFAPGIYQGLAFYPRAWDQPHEALRTWRPVWRNYFGYAELTGAQWQPARVALDPPIWSYPLVLRAGVAHAT